MFKTKHVNPSQIKLSIGKSTQGPSDSPRHLIKYSEFIFLSPLAVCIVVVHQIEKFVAERNFALKTIAFPQWLESNNTRRNLLLISTLKAKENI